MSELPVPETDSQQVIDAFCSIIYEVSERSISVLVPWKLRAELFGELILQIRLSQEVFEEVGLSIRSVVVSNRLILFFDGEQFDTAEDVFRSLNKEKSSDN